MMPDPTWAQEPHVQAGLYQVDEEKKCPHTTRAPQPADEALS